MIEAVIAILITLLNGGDLCGLGENIDWYKWDKEHPDMTAPVRVQLEDHRFWIIQADGETILFVYDLGNMPHGQCAVKLESE